MCRPTKKKTVPLASCLPETAHLEGVAGSGESDRSPRGPSQQASNMVAWTASPLPVGDLREVRMEWVPIKSSKDRVGSERLGRWPSKSSASWQGSSPRRTRSTRLLTTYCPSSSSTL